MTRKTALLVASILAIVHVVLACVYASITPYRTAGVVLTSGPAPDVGAPDERQHANYVKHLIDGKGFPVLDPKDPELGENYQAHQPPLFYLLEAGWVKVSGADLTSSDEGLKVRMLNTLIGGATVLGVFFLGLWAFKREDVGLIAAAFAALLPMNCALSGALSNDPLLFCLCTWTLAICALAIKDGWTLKLAAIAGILGGLAILTKTTGISLVPALLIAAFLAKPRADVKQIGVAALLLILICGPWLARNQSQYGDPLAMSAFNEAFKNSPSREKMKEVAEIQNPGKPPELAYWVDWVGWSTLRSFYGAFGYMDIFLNEGGTFATSDKSPNSLYRMLLALTVVMLAAWAFALRKPEWQEHKGVNALLGVYALIIFLLFAGFNAKYFQGQARYIFPALGPIAIGFAIGGLNLARGRWQAALGVLGGLLLLLNLYAFSRLPDEFRKRTGLVSVREFDPTETGLLSVCIGNAGETGSV